MRGGRSARLIVVVLALVAAACGDDSGDGTATDTAAAGAATDDDSTEDATDEPMEDTGDEPMGETDGESHSEGDHEHADPVEVAAEGAPTVRFEATENRVAGGADLMIIVENFEIVDEGGTSDTARYFGHAHVLVDGELASMVFADRYTVALAPGENLVRVELSDTNHASLTLGGTAIAYEAMVHIPEDPSTEFHVHEVGG